jgi:hypothetical protein
LTTKKFKTEEEGWLLEKIASDLDVEVTSLEVRYEKNVLSNFAVYVVVSLGKNFSFDLKDRVRRKIRKVVTAEQPTADLFVRFV